jgi:expansin (peptidoglycan-binding protein)
MPRIRVLLACVAILVACSSSSSGPDSTSDDGGGGGGGGGGDGGGGGGGDGGGGGGDGGGGGGDANVVTTDGGLTTYGQKYEGGQFHLGPVDYAETAFHNACAPGTKYASSVSQAEGNLLVGLWNGIPNVEGYCDACIYVLTAKGKSAILRVVTYGDTSTNSIDVSQQAFDILNSGEFPRAMTWQFAKCPDTGKVMYEFQTGSSADWTSLWVRNARVPLTKVEVQSANHASYAPLERGSDGTLTDNAGFGTGTFTIRLTGLDGKTVSDTFSWPAGGIAGKTLTGQGNFQ